MPPRPPSGPTTDTCPVLRSKRVTVATTVDDVWIERIGRNEAVLVDVDRKPVAVGNRAVVAATRHADRAVLLLPAANPIRKRVVRRDVVELPGRLVVPGTPGLSAVERHDRALVGGEQDDVGVVRVDPAVLIVLPAWSALERRPGLPAVGRLPRHGARHDHDVGILRMRDRHRQVAATDPASRPRIGRDTRPRFAGIIAAIQADRAAIARRAGLVVAGHGCVQPFGICRRNREIRLDDDRQSSRERLPRRATIYRLEHAAVGAGPHRVLPRALTFLPHRGVHGLGVRRIDVDVVAASVLILREHLFEGLAAIGRAINAALVVGTVGMAERGHEEPVGVLRIDNDGGNLLRVAQSEVRPCPAGVGRLVDAVARREIRTVKAFAAADVNRAGVGGSDGDRTDGTCGLVVEDRFPDAAGVSRLPDAAVDRRHIEGVRMARVAGRRAGPACAVRADVPPAQLG